MANVQQFNLLAKLRFQKVFFGWWTVIVSGLLACWGFGFNTVGFAAFFKPIATELGLNRTVTSVASSISRFEGGIQTPVAGWLSDRFGPRMVVVCGVAIVGLGLVLMYWVNSVWTFYIVWAGIMSTGVNVALTTSVDKATSNWFVKKRGLALGIRWVITGFSVVAMLPFVTWLIMTVGWRMATVIGGVVMWLVGLPLAWFFIKSERPEHYGLLPDGAKVEPGLKKNKDQMIARGVEYAASFQEVEFTLRQTMRVPSFWLLNFGYLGHIALFGVITTHSIPFLTDMGVSPVKAAAIMSMASLIGLPMRFFGGSMADRLAKGHMRFLMGGTILLDAVGVTAFLMVPSLTMVRVFLTLLYIGHGVGVALRPAMYARYFGRKGFGSIIGISSLVMGVVGIIVPVYAGWVFDTTGSYLGAFRLFAWLTTISAVIIWFAAPPKPPAEITDIRKFI